MSLPLAQAFLEQARADFKTYEMIKTQAPYPCSQWLHLLQMTLEKTAKAYLAPGTKDAFERLRQSHRSFGKFMQIVDKYTIVQTSLHMHSKRALKDHIRALMPLVNSIEQIIPARENYGPTAEYPWRNPQGGFYSPCLYDFSEISREFEDNRHAQALLNIVIHALNNDEWHKTFGIK
jgi:hypothetical protein